MTRGTRDFMEHLITVYRYSRMPGVLMRSSTLYTLLCCVVVVVVVAARPSSVSIVGKGRGGGGDDEKAVRFEIVGTVPFSSLCIGREEGGQ